MLKSIVNSPVKSGDQTILDGNLVIGTAGKGLDFSADSHLAGMTSEVLDDYEEGTWVPTFRGMGDVITVKTARYTKIGRIVHYELAITIPTTADGDAFEWTLPYQAVDANTGASVTFSNKGLVVPIYVTAGINNTYHRLKSNAGASYSYASFSASDLNVVGTYTAA